MKKLAIATSIAIASAVSAFAAGFDGMNLVTNSWFAADFTADLATGSAIVANSSTGVTYGAGTWTAVPATGTAVIAADEDAGGGKTMLSLEAPGEELTFTPSPYASPSGMETFVSEIKADALDSDLPVLGPEVQSAFTLFDDGEGIVSAMAWTVSGWTNFTYAASGLTNAWFTLYSDFATVGGVRYVRYSVKPASGSLAILTDASGTAWFQSPVNASSVTSVSLSGTADVRNLSGDSLEEVVAATYNGVAYQTFEAAIAAGIADNWANGNVVLLADAEWSPAERRHYYIDTNGHELTVSGVDYTVNGTDYSVTHFQYCWIGGAATDWANGANWSRTVGGEVANAYPNSSSDEAFFPAGASLTLNAFVTVGKILTDGTLTLSGNGSGGIRTASANNAAPFNMDGTGLVRLAGVSINVPYATSSAGGETKILSDLEIVAGTTNTFTLCVGSSRYASLHLRGALSGSGTMTVRCNTDSGNYQAYLYGDASAFAGVFNDRREGDEYAARINVMLAAALSASATYNLSATYNAAGQNYVLRAGGTGTTYRMGALNGEVHFDGNNNTKTTQYYGYILEIGGKNENCSFGGTIARNGYASNTKKVGTADMTFTGSQIPNITIENGTYIIGSTTALPNTMIFTGGAFSVAEGVAVDPPSKFSSDSTAPVVFDDRGIANSWGGGLTDARVPYGFTKKGAGTLTLTTKPTHTTTTTIEDGTLVVPQGTTIAKLACAGGKLTVPLAGTEDETDVLTISTLAEGTTLEDVKEAVAVVGATMSVEASAGGYVVKATRTAQTFVWTGAADTAWENVANWTVGGVTAMTAPIAVDTAVFPAELGDKTNVVLSARATVAEVIADSDVALSGALICSPMYRGEGKLILGDGAGFYVNATTVVSNDLEVAGDVAVTPSTTYIPTRFYGNISGGGTLTLGGRGRHMSSRATTLGLMA